MAITRLPRLRVYVKFMRGITHGYQIIMELGDHFTVWFPLLCQHVCFYNIIWIIYNFAPYSDSDINYNWYLKKCLKRLRNNVSYDSNDKCMEITILFIYVVVNSWHVLWRTLVLNSEWNITNVYVSFRYLGV